MDAAFEVSSSTGSVSIFTVGTDEALVVPDKLDPVDIERSVFTLTCSFSSSSKRRFLGELARTGSSACTVSSISWTNWHDSPADCGALARNAESLPQVSGAI